MHSILPQPQLRFAGRTLLAFSAFLQIRRIEFLGRLKGFVGPSDQWGLNEENRWESSASARPPMKLQVMKLRRSRPLFSFRFQKGNFVAGDRRFSVRTAAQSPLGGSQALGGRSSSILAKDFTVNRLTGQYGYPKDM
jgi:hypothetical protein